MTPKTWAYGTTRPVRIERVETYGTLERMRVIVVCVEIVPKGSGLAPEGFILIDPPGGSELAKGDVAVIVFRPGGIYGGHWEFESTPNRRGQRG